MRLYIAEKPSMGRELAACLQGPVERKDGYLVTRDGVVTWAFGHILRQAEPEEYDAKYKRWQAEDLPIAPQCWKMIIDKSSEKQFNIIKGLIAQADEIVHAGDPDREGQLLIDEVLDYVGCKKPVKRILLNALDEESIKRANANLQDNRDFVNLKLSALARARADWLIGMNLSRAYTLAARRSGRKQVMAIGRVKTPTLALVVRRERELQNFKPIDYYTLKAEFAHEQGNFQANWKPQELQSGLDSEGRLIDETIAKQLLDKFAAQVETSGKITAYSKTKKQEPQRLPFSLSSLQVLAGKRFGYEPQLVLDTAQSLYEKKLTTYPRSDCEYLPKSQFGDGAIILRNLAGSADEQLRFWAGQADSKLKSRAWNDKKITAHHAIIPTKVKVDITKLPAAERNIYKLIAQAYIAQFYPVHIYNQTKVSVEYADELFTVSGRTVVDAGWKALYQTQKQQDEEADKDGADTEDNSSKELPLMKRGDTVNYLNGSYDKKATKPPQRFTGATLLAGMKDIHKYVKDTEVKKKLKDIYGIGTEATRATIIEDLIKRGFLITEGKKKYLVPTDSAYMMIDALPDEMTYPDSTAVWEDYLHSLTEGQGSVDEFLQQQVEFTTKLCAKAQTTVLATENEVKCPRCKQGIMIKRQGKNGAFWGCSNFPKCKMTANDVDNKPVFRQFTAKTTGSESVVTVADQSVASGFMSMWDLVANSSRPHNTAPKYSAAPQEQLAKQTKAEVGKDQSTYLCPHCKDGKLRRIRGKNGFFWGCGNYPHCTSTYDDINGKPAL